MSFRRCVSVAAVALLAGGGLLALSGGRAEAQTGSGVELVTDYQNYPDTPQARLPADCDGGGLFHSELFSLNGGTPVSDPKLLPEFNAGDTLTMTWNATTPECVGAPVVLTVKVAQDSVFDFGDDQHAYVPYAMTVADGGPGSLSYTLPGLEGFGFGCAYQFDAIVGLPLAVVGPSGSDYSAGVRGDNKRTTLIAFRNGAYENCVAEVTTTTTSAPTTTTTTEAATTTTSEASATTTTTPLEVFTPTTDAPTLAPVAVEAAGAQRTLAATGSSSVPWALMAASAVLVGLAALVVSRRLHHA